MPTTEMSTALDSERLTTANQQIAFFSLPAEIRIHIYELHYWSHTFRDFDKTICTGTRRRVGVSAALRRVCHQMRQEYTAVCFADNKILLQQRFFRIDGSMVAVKPIPRIFPAREDDLKSSDVDVEESLAGKWVAIGSRGCRRMLQILDEQLIRNVRKFEVLIPGVNISIDFSASREIADEQTAVFGEGFVVSAYNSNKAPDAAKRRARSELLAGWLADKVRDRQPAYLTKEEVEELAAYHAEVDGCNKLWDDLKALWMVDGLV